MVSFCENKTDCRRALQLSYFGENFNREICKANKPTVCDNCSSSVCIFVIYCFNQTCSLILYATIRQVEFTQMDVTEDCKAIATAVDSLCGKSGKWSNNYTINHFVDIFKGSELKKIVELRMYSFLICSIVFIVNLFFFISKRAQQNPASRTR